MSNVTRKVAVAWLESQRIPIALGGGHHPRKGFHYGTNEISHCSYCTCHKDGPKREHSDRQCSMERHFFLQPAATFLRRCCLYLKGQSPAMVMPSSGASWAL